MNVLYLLFVLSLSFSPAWGNSTQVVSHDDFLGPEGLALSPGREVFVANMGSGVISRRVDRKTYKLYANLSNLKGWTSRTKILGLDFDQSGHIYVASPNYRGGSLIRITPTTIPEKTFQFVYDDNLHGQWVEVPNRWNMPNVQMKVLASDLGKLNEVRIDRKRGILYTTVTDMEMFGGGVYRYPLRTLNDPFRKNKLQAENFKLFPLAYANGFELKTHSDKAFVTNTVDGILYKVDLRTGDKVKLYENSDSWADGLLYIPEQEVLLLAGNKTGSIFAFDTSGELLNEFVLKGVEDQLSPASMVYKRETGAVYVSDLWEANTFRVFWDAVMPEVFKKEDGGPLTKLHRNLYRVRLQTILSED